MATEPKTLVLEEHEYVRDDLVRILLVMYAVIATVVMFCAGVIVGVIL